MQLEYPKIVLSLENKISLKEKAKHWNLNEKYHEFALFPREESCQLEEEQRDFQSMLKKPNDVNPIGNCDASINMPFSYHPIFVLNSMGKILERVI